MTLDVIVVGAGLAGSATAWRAAEQGLSVLVVEQFEPGHRHGSSHGSSRIVRRAYADGTYTHLTGLAFELWREAELAADTALLDFHGGIDFGTDRPVDQIAANLAESGVPHELLSAADAMQRWPGMAFDTPVVFHDQAGTVDAERAVATFLNLAVARGAQVRHCARVSRLEATDDVATVWLDDGERVSAAVVVVASGAWLPEVAGAAELALPLPPVTVTQQQIFHFPRRDTTAAPWPSVIHAADGAEHYHLSGGRDGGEGLDRKIAEHHHGTLTSAKERDGVIDPDSRARVIEYVQTWLPGLVPEPRGEASCLYTHTPSQNFLIDRQGPIVVCSPCSGHGAKFAPAVGQWTTDLVLGQAGAVPERFRFAAHGPDAPPSWSL